MKDSQITKKLPKGYSIQELDSKPFWELVDKKMRETFANSLILKSREVYSDSEREKLKALSENFQQTNSYHAVIIHEGNMVA